MQTQATDLNLTMEVLDPIDAPLSDLEWGALAGAAFGVGVVVGAAVVLT